MHRSAPAGLLVASLVLWGCSCRPGPCPPGRASIAPVAPPKPAPSTTLQTISSQLHVGMSFEEVRELLRPFQDRCGTGALGGLGFATFTLRDGTITLAFSLADDVGRSDCADADRRPTEDRRGSPQLVPGGDFQPVAGAATSDGADPGVWRFGLQELLLVGGIEFADYARDGQAIEAAMDRANVPVYIIGSLSYGISVPKQDAERARAVVRGTPLARYFLEPGAK